VVLDGAGLSDAAMQRFANWTNLSETTFVLPPTEGGPRGRCRLPRAHLHPGGELPFAGHPTLGTCHAWLEAGGQPRARVMPSCRNAASVWCASASAGICWPLPRHRCTQLPPDEALLARAPRWAAAAADPGRQVLDNGPVWLGLLLDSPDTVLALEPDHACAQDFGPKSGRCQRQTVSRMLFN
jgi:predicted PhzF superfamily epimerase YddE/YHI9